MVWSAAVGQDGNGLQHMLKKLGQLFQVVSLCLRKSLKVMVFALRSRVHCDQLKEDYPLLL